LTEPRGLPSVERLRCAVLLIPPASPWAKLSFHVERCFGGLPSDLQGKTLGCRRLSKCQCVPPVDSNEVPTLATDTEQHRWGILPVSAINSLKMPFEIVWELRGAQVIYSGQVTASELAKAFVSVNADQRYDDLLYVLADYRASTSINVTDEQLIELACIDYAAALSNPRIAQAHVVDDVRVVRQLRHYMANNDSEHRQGIFSRVEDAHAWIHDHCLNRPEH